MQIHFEDKDYTLDLDEITLTQARYLYRNCGGMTLGKLRDGASDLNPDAIAALYWLMKAQSGEVIDLGKIHDFPLVKFMQAVAEAAEAEGEENPTETAEAEAPALPTT